MYFYQAPGLDQIFLGWGPVKIIEYHHWFIKYQNFY